MLEWYGKRAPKSIEYFPAQEKEVYGDLKAKDFYTKLGFIEVESYLDKEPLLGSGVCLPLTKMVYT